MQKIIQIILGGLLFFGAAFAGEECYMYTPYGYQSIGGKHKIGPYASESACRDVNGEYFKGQGRCDCKTISESGGSEPRRSTQEIKTEESDTAELLRQREEMERRQQDYIQEQARLLADEEARKEEWEKQKRDVLFKMKGVSDSDFSLKGGESFGMAFKETAPVVLFEKGYQGSPPVDLTQVKVQEGTDIKIRAELLGNFANVIKERTEQPDETAAGIRKFLKTGEPPDPVKSFGELKSGDVILIAPDPLKIGHLFDSMQGRAIRFLDRFTSNSWNSPASHSALFIGERNGKRWYLDNTTEHGTVIIDEEAFLKKYQHRKMFSATIAKPLSKHEAEELWKGAHELGRDRRHTGIIDKTNYGITGGDNMVCSEAARWVLVRAGRRIPESSGHSKELKIWPWDFNVRKQTGSVNFGPADFYELQQYFVVMPLEIDSK